MDDADISDRLARHGYVVCDGFIDAAHAAALADNAEVLYRDGHFRAAGVGAQRHVMREVRGDEIFWIEKPSAVQRLYVERLAQLAEQINRRLLLGLISLECHLARYAPGLGYARHRDRQQQDDARTVSCTLYLNDHWRDEDGGQLRLYPLDGPPVDVLPRAGTMACFLSDEIEHEVLATRRVRWSLASWLRRRGRDALDVRGIALAALR